MSTSCCIFSVRLVVFLVPLQTSIAPVVGSITFIFSAAYFVAIFLPIPNFSCVKILSFFVFSFTEFLKEVCCQHGQGTGGAIIGQDIFALFY
ncbi:hypothetical protein EV421DRAFT_1086748 [Armillaria borealis]|uniref:Uncharacterized protein n=1 Tax=Armillaria borealis TaxID=47425 RepID=A0AA39MKS7_9AGAR|nr:hypothetical protein EV421DRAFT_1086748 [Armillaria borealis]